MLGEARYQELSQEPMIEREHMSADYAEGISDLAEYVFRVLDRHGPEGSLPGDLNRLRIDMVNVIETVRGLRNDRLVEAFNLH